MANKEENEKPFLESTSKKLILTMIIIGLILSIALLFLIYMYFFGVPELVLTETPTYENYSQQNYYQQQSYYPQQNYQQQGYQQNYYPQQNYQQQGYQQNYYPQQGYQ